MQNSVNLYWEGTVTARSEFLYQVFLHSFTQCTLLGSLFCTTSENKQTHQCETFSPRSLWCSRGTESPLYHLMSSTWGFSKHFHVAVLFDLTETSKAGILLLLDRWTDKVCLGCAGSFWWSQPQNHSLCDSGHVLWLLRASVFSSVKRAWIIFANSVCKVLSP